MRRALTIAGCLLATVVQAEAAPVTLEPGGSWKVDYAQRTCVLSRLFSAGGQAYRFEAALEPVTPLAWLRLGSSDKVRVRDDGKAIVAVDGTELKSRVHYNIFESQSGGAVREFMLENFRTEVGRAKQTLRLRLGKHGDFRINLGEFEKAMAAAGRCLEDLHRSLGVDPALLSSVAVTPEGSAFSFVDFPRNTGGLDLILLYWVNVEGRVDDCRLLAPTGHQKFDDTVCATLKEKGRFSPGRDTVGTAIRAPRYEYIRLRTGTRISTTPL